MGIVENIEKSGVEMFKQAPHLPKNVRDWITNNAWWIVLIGVILSILSVLSLVPILAGASVINSMYAAYAPYAAASNGNFIIAAWVSLIFLAVVVYLEAMAIKPLQAKTKRGWDLVFLAFLVSIASSLVNFVITMQVSSLLGIVLAVVIGGYFLFEARGGFVQKSDKK
ncbi:MAG TPA: hypothetical protein VGE13_03455 [Candidatus Saccharimonadales bacterium]